MNRTTLFRIIFIALMLLFIGIIVFFAWPQTQQQQDQEKIEIAIPAMQQFLKDKYGIAPSLENVVVCHETLNGYESSETGESLPLVTAEFSVDEHKYYVCADITDEKNIICYDDYQQDEIKNIIISYLHDIIGAEAIYCQINIVDVHKHYVALLQHLGHGNVNLINKKITKFEDLLANPQESMDDTDYMLTNIAIFYMDVEPIFLTEQQIQDFKHLSQIAIVNLNNTDTLFALKDNVINPYYLLPDMNDCVVLGKNLVQFRPDGDILVYNRSTPNIIDDVMFCFYDEITIQTANVDVPEKSVTPAFKMGEYTCIIPTSMIQKFKHAKEYEIILVDSENNKTHCRVFNDFFYQETATGGYYCFNNLIGQYSHYDYWYFTELE